MGLILGTLLLFAFALICGMAIERSYVPLSDPHPERMSDTWRRQRDAL